MFKKPLNSMTESFYLRWTMIVIVLVFLTLFLFFPLAVVFARAFEKGWHVYTQSLNNADALAAIKLTLITSICAVSFNLIFGLCAAWAIGKFDFIGKHILITLIDLPFAVSPVISGLIYVLMFGLQGYFGAWFFERDISIIFALPGIILTTIFVTFPFVVREIVPLMHSQGSQEEEAAIVLGAGFWRTFWHVTLPNIKWGLIYGLILTNARAMGEFGAVSVVSGHIRGLTNTIPLHVEILYNEYNYVSAFATASILALLALLTIVVKTVVEYKINRKNLNQLEESL